MKNILYVIGFILLCLAGIAGAPVRSDNETSIGYFKVSANAYGIAIYQDRPHASVQFVNARSFTVKGNTVTIPSASTVVYSRDDIIFDTKFIYTEATQEQIDFLGKKRVTASSRIIPIGKSIYLINPHIPGMLELRGSNMHIDLDQKQIEGSIKTVVVHDTFTI